MPFPFTILYNKPLKVVVTPDNKQQVLQYIQIKIKEDKANNILIEDYIVRYKGSTSNRKGSLFGSVDKGEFALLMKNNQWYLTYKVYTRSLFYSVTCVSTAMGLYMGIGGGVWWGGIIPFLWLFGVSWLVILARHNGVVVWLVIGINELICGKEPETKDNSKEKSEELKSWF